MPQFDFAYWPGQIAWALIVFAVVYLVLRATILPRMRRTLEERSGRIQADMVEARRLRDEAEAQAEGARAETAEARAKALKTAADAKAKSAAEAAARNADLEKDLATKLAAAEDRIRASRDMALRQVPGIAGDTASALVEKLSGRAPDAGEIDRAAATAA